jgi:hypothetical protein
MVVTMAWISYQFIVTLDSDEELSDGAKDAVAAALARAVPRARRITCARAGQGLAADETRKAIRSGRSDLN